MVLWKKCLIISTIIVFVFTVVLYILQQRELSEKYGRALAYAEQGDYENALNVVSRIGLYKESEELTEEYTNELYYEEAVQLIAKGDFDGALPLLQLLNSVGGQGFKDSLDLQYEVEYNRAAELAKNGKFEDALLGFRNLPSSYLDTQSRIEELTYARRFVDTWYCKEHQIDLEVTGYINDENVTYLNCEMRDRNGFLLGDETNKLYGKDLVLMEDRFIWDLFEDGTRYAVLYEDNKLKFAKQPVTENDFIVTFVRKLDNYNSIDGNINAAVDADVDAGVK